MIHFYQCQYSYLLSKKALININAISIVRTFSYQFQCQYQYCRFCLSIFPYQCIEQLCWAEFRNSMNTWSQEHEQQLHESSANRLQMCFKTEGGTGTCPANPDNPLCCPDNLYCKVKNYVVFGLQLQVLQWGKFYLKDKFIIIGKNALNLAY